jgi:hypothetical protein
MRRGEFIAGLGSAAAWHVRISAEGTCGDMTRGCSVLIGVGESLEERWA